MSHKVILFLIAASALICANLAEAQQPKKLPRIGYLSPSDPGSESTRSDRFRVALRELGYIEGQNIAIEYRYAEGKRERNPEIAAELVHLKVDVIVVAGADPLIRAAKNATKTIPMVIAGGAAGRVEAGQEGRLCLAGRSVPGLSKHTEGP